MEDYKHKTLILIAFWGLLMKHEVLIIVESNLKVTIKKSFFTPNSLHNMYKL
jgi:arginine decarboxylase-like protein